MNKKHKIEISWNSKYKLWEANIGDLSFLDSKAEDAFLSAQDYLDALDVDKAQAQLDRENRDKAVKTEVLNTLINRVGQDYSYHGLQAYVDLHGKERSFGRPAEITVELVEGWLKQQKVSSI